MRDALERSLRRRRDGHLQDQRAPLLQAVRLQPHRSEHFKLSTDAFFIEKLRDVVGLYLSPPDNALVLCVDEKSQCQALERTQPMLPLGLGYVEGVTHDYVRHGTTTLFAALNVLNGAVLAECKPRHLHQEFVAFLRTIYQSVPVELDIHCIVDNYFRLDLGSLDHLAPFVLFGTLVGGELLRRTTNGYSAEVHEPLPTSGCFSAMATSEDRRLTMSAGVPAGTHIANHDDASKSFMSSASAMVGTSG